VLCGKNPSSGITANFYHKGLEVGAKGAEGMWAKRGGSLCELCGSLGGLCGKTNLNALI